MIVTNKTSFGIIAFGWDNPKDYGDDVLIAPGETADVNGPYVGEMGGVQCYLVLEGSVTCHEQPDDENGFQIARGQPVFLGAANRGITIRHAEDAPEEVVLQWRRSCSRPKNSGGSASEAGTA